MLKKCNLVLYDPYKGRLKKPRSNGLTMIIDKGMGLNELRDLIDMASEFIDFIKFSFGTSFIYPEKILLKKINIIKDADIDVYPGGTLFEVAVEQGRMADYFKSVKELGFTAVEISDGTLHINKKIRNKAIKMALAAGFKVLSEVGKKDRDNSLSLEDMQALIKNDLNMGVYKVIVEGRESGKDISIYKKNGALDQNMLKGIIDEVEGKVEKIIWEAPLKKQQLIFLKMFGPNANFGNIHPYDIVAIEALRRGFRGDTFNYYLKEKTAGV